LADLPNVSGTRVASRSREAQPEPADEAHAEMERAVARGVCRILSNSAAADGTTHQWSAWLTEQGHLIVQEWHRPRLGTWKTGPSFVIDSAARADLVELLSTSVKTGD
jgi:hypothetical protein